MNLLGLNQYRTLIQTHYFGVIDNSPLNHKKDRFNVTEALQTMLRRLRDDILTTDMKILYYT